MADRYSRLIFLRRAILAIAWVIVVLSIFFIPCVRSEVLAFRPGEEDYAGWLVVLSNLLGILTIDSPSWLHTDPMKYHLLVLSDILTCIAHLCFLSTALAALVRPRSLAATLLRYPSCLLVFIWTYPVIDHFHSLKIGVWRLQDGFYFWGAGYMLAMCAVIYSPKNPADRKGFPVSPKTN